MTRTLALAAALTVAACATSPHALLDRDVNNRVATAAACAASIMRLPVSDTLPRVVYVRDRDELLRLLARHPGYMRATGNAFYEPVFATVFMASGLDPAVEWTALVHELAHHLQFINARPLDEAEAQAVDRLAPRCLPRED